MSRRPTFLTSIVAPLLLGLLPVQLAAHCGVPFPGFSGHDHAHHASSRSPAASVPPAALEAAADDAACTLTVPTFTVRRDPTTGWAAVSGSRLVHLSAFAPSTPVSSPLAAALFVLSRPLPLSLRI